MLKWPSKDVAFQAVIVLIFAALVGMAVGIIPKTASICEYTYQGQPKNCTQHSIFLAAIPNVIHVIDLHNGFVTALATVVIGIFTIFLAKASIYQGNLSSRSIDLARDEFNATHRPRIRVRQVVLTPRGQHDMFGLQMLSHGQKIEVQITLANVGDGAAEIATESRLRFFFYQEGVRNEPWVLDNLSVGIVDQPVTLGIGASRSFNVSGLAVLHAPNDGMTVLRQFATENWRLIVFGEISYTDNLKNTRVTGFIRKWDSGIRFRRVDEPDMEYED